MSSLPSSVQDSLPHLLPPGHRLTRSTLLTSLWAGYGSLYRLTVTAPSPSSSPYTLIVKYINPPSSSSPFSVSSTRKFLSYTIETNFYLSFRSLLPPDVDAPRLIGSRRCSDGGKVVILSDLRDSYPFFAERRGTLAPDQVDLAIEWLARFHARFFGIASSPSPVEGMDVASFCAEPSPSNQDYAGQGLWRQGGYTYLSTRLSELASIPSSSIWSKLGLNSDGELAYAVDWCLRNPTERRRLTLCHGDVKAANMAFHPTAGKVTFYDFQYVGLSLGVQDLAKFFATSTPSLLTSHVPLLRRYYDRFIASLHASNPDRTMEVETWYPWTELQEDFDLAVVAWTSFLAGWSGGFWGNVEWLQDRAEGLLRDDVWTEKVKSRWRDEGKGERPSG